MNGARVNIFYASQKPLKILARGSKRQKIITIEHMDIRYKSKEFSRWICSEKKSFVNISEQKNTRI